jgi:two-component sensor histidine kinase
MSKGVATLIMSERPTIEERLEALAQSLELLYRDQQQDAANIHSLALIARDSLASIQSLERTATGHQERLDEHQKRIEDLEDQH